jgi:hypothetical protein
MSNPTQTPPGGRRQFIDAVGWQATTSEAYRRMPHEWTHRTRATAGKPPQPALFDWFVHEIREHGYDKPFTNVETGRTHTYRYLDAQDGRGRWFKFWTMGVRTDTVIVNREPIANPDQPGAGS